MLLKTNFFALIDDFCLTIETNISILNLLILVINKKLTIRRITKLNLENYKVKDMKGEEVSLADYKGKAVLVINTATECGFTPQYKPLEEMYEKYAIELIRKEGVETALERSIMTMMEWAAENEPAPWNHYFQHIGLNTAVWNIKDGKISPWLILNSKTGKDMLSKFNDEQLNMIYHVLDPSHWAMRFKRNPKDVELVKDVVKESNL